VTHAILSYGVYVPHHRVRHVDIAAALGGRGGDGSRIVASFDEDSTTMAVEAARRALDGQAAPTAIYLATTSPPYMDKTNAATVHAALGLDPVGFAVDMAGSARGAIGALRAGAADGGLALLSDVRTGLPGSADERESADAAAAFLFGEAEDSIADVIGRASVTAEFLDRWRSPDELASRHWEERFGLESYLPLVQKAAGLALEAAGVSQPDHVVVSSPHSRAARQAASRLPATQPLRAANIGFAGAADVGLRLADALDNAQPGETILVIAAIDGCDALVLRISERIGHRRPEPLAAQLDAGRTVSYATYLAWRGLLERELPRRPEPDRPSAPASSRTRSWKFGFVGSRCESCGFVEMPPARVCKHCRSVDRMQPAPLAGVGGTVATFTVDRLAFSLSPPVIDVVVDFDGGGRCMLELADAGPDEVAIGMRTEMTFRRLYTSGGVHNYFWKARPARTIEGV
jgi:hydroxymethylglutaryl-CoA synthase